MTFDISISKETYEKINRFIIGILGQYGRKWEDLTELQRATYEQDVKKLTSGILYEYQIAANEAITLAVKSLRMEKYIHKHRHDFQLGVKDKDKFQLQTFIHPA
jgi:hypothetical protein